MSEFYWVVTTAGQAEIAAATIGSPIVLDDFSVGDGNGAYTTPAETDVALVNELIRKPLDSVYTDVENYPGQAIVNGRIPADHSAYYSIGITIREVGIWSATGDLFAIGKVAETVKPLITDGTAEDFGISAYLQISDTALITTTVDPTVITASKDYVDRYTQIVRITRAMPTTLNGYVECLQVIAGALSCTVKITKDDGDAEGSKVYHMVFNENTTTEDAWCNVLPFSCSSVTNDNDWGLDVKWDKDANGAMFRVRLLAVDGVTPPTGDFFFELLYAGYDANVTDITYLSATGTDATVTDISSSSAITQANGKVGIGIMCPTHTLEVDGEGVITGTFRYANELYNISIGTGAGFIASMADYIAGSPAAGDRIIITQDEEITSKMTIPDGVLIRQWKGAKFTNTTDLDAIIELGDDIEIEEELRIETSHTGTLGTFIHVNGEDNNINKLRLYNTSTGNVTNAVSIASGKLSNRAAVEASNTGAGSIVNNLNDNSGNSSNHIIVFSDSGEIERSIGAKTFADGLIIENGGDAEGDMYYRSASGEVASMPAGGDTSFVIYQNGIPTTLEPGREGQIIIVRNGQFQLVDREEQTMIAPVKKGGLTTAADAGILQDSGGDFVNNGIITDYLVNVPGVWNEMMFQILSLTATAITLKNSSTRNAGITIPLGAPYTIHYDVPNQEWREILEDNLSAVAGGSDTAVAAIDTEARLIKVVITLPTTTGTGYQCYITYGDIPVTTVISDYLDNVAIVYLRTKFGSNNLTITMTGLGAGTHTCRVRYFESVDVANSTKSLINETALNS